MSPSITTPVQVPHGPTPFYLNTCTLYYTLSYRMYTLGEHCTVCKLTVNAVYTNIMPRALLFQSLGTPDTIITHLI